MSSFLDTSEDNKAFHVPDVVSGKISRELTASMDEILGSFSDRDRNHIFDPDHRDAFLSTLLSYCDRLREPVDGSEYTFIGPDSSDETLVEKSKSGCEEIVGIDEIKKKRGRGRLKNSVIASSSSSLSSLLPTVPSSEDLSHESKDGNNDETTPISDEPVETNETANAKHSKNVNHVPFTDGNAYLIKEYHEPEGGCSSVSIDDTFLVNVLFDGEERSACKFRVNINGESSTFPIDDARKWTAVDLSAKSEDEAWSSLHLIGADKPTDAPPTSSIASASICLECSETYPYDNEVILPDKTLLARSEDDFIHRVLRTDIEVYRRMLQSAKDRMDNLLTAGVRDRAICSESQRKQWSEVENIYLKQV